MTADDPLERFSDLEQPYPGRRKPVNRERAPVSPDSELWDAKPIMYVVGGEKKPFFLIRHLAMALGYSVQSIRAWESAGLLPNTPYRSPRAKGMMAGGRSDKGHRLWTREQIDGILRLAKKHGVILNRTPPTPAFASDVAKLFNELLGEN
jgi:hypothetical protein